MVGIPSTAKRRPMWLSRRTGLGVGAATLVTGLAAMAVVVSSGLATDSYMEESGKPLALSLPAVPVLLLLIAMSWLVVADHPVSVVGFAVICTSWLLPSLAAWSLPPAAFRADLLAAAPLEAAGIALVIGGWTPSGTGGRARLLAAAGLASAAAAVVHLVGYDPFFDPACQWTCASAPTDLSGHLGVRHTLELSAALTGAACAAGVVASLRSREAPGVLRASGCLAATLVAVAAVVPIWRWGSTTPWAGEDLLTSVGTAGLVLAAFAAVVHTRSVRLGVRDVVEHLADVRIVGGARSSIAAVHFADPHDGRWLDAAGSVVAKEPEHCAVLSDIDGPAVRLVLGRWTQPGPVVSSITPAGRLTLENARLNAAARAHAQGVQASLRRIVETTDAERRRIERDLHDGAQQRLVAVTMRLGSRIHRSQAISGTLAEADADVREALSRLRDLFHDFLPAVLDVEGLQAAVEDLAAATPIQVELHVSVGAPAVTPAVQAAAYLAVVAALDNVVTHTRADGAQISVVLKDEILTVTVTDHGPGGAVIGTGLTGVADRIGALGGSLRLTSIAGEGTTMSVRVPCG